MILPAKYAVRDYLRKQGQKQDKLSSDMTEVLLNRFHAAYKKHRIDADALKSFADEYRGYLSEAGSFSLQTSYTPPTKVSPHRERATVAGYAVEPISLGQGWGGVQSDFYTENAALIRCHTGEFGRKKASLGQGYGGVALTQHVMERVYERTEIEWTALPALVERELTSLLQALAISEICDLWLDHVSDRVGGYRFTAVPYSNGLMLANLRMVFGTFADGDFGFRLQIPSGRIETPFLNKDWILEDLHEGRFLRGDSRPVSTICGVTYFNLVTLNDQEADYYHGFRALMDEIGEELLNAFSYFRFAPTLPHQRHPALDLRQRFGPRIQRLKGLLGEGWLKPNITSPLCLLLPFDHEVPRKKRSFMATS